MKKILFVVLFCLGFVSGFAQGFGADLLVGANFSQVDGDALAGYNKLGLNAGIAITRDYSEDWQFGFELLYSSKGARNIIDPDVGGVPIKMTWNYVEVPLLATYQFNDNIEFFGGPGVGVNVLNERDENGNIQEVEQLRLLEFALTLGGTYYISDNLGLSLRHTYSFVSVRDQNIIVVSPTWLGSAGWYNRLFTAGIKYRLKT